MMNFNIDGKDIKVGFSVCRDAQFYPEVYRYYAASNADLLVHFSASSLTRLARECVLGSYSSRDKIGVIACNLWGSDGPPEKVSTLKKTSLVCSPRLDGTYEYDSDGRDIELYGFGLSEMSLEGLEVGTTLQTGRGMDLFNCGFSKGRLNFEVVAKMFDELSSKYYSDYKSLYPGSRSRDPLSKPIKISY